MPGFHGSAITRRDIWRVRTFCMATDQESKQSRDDTGLIGLSTAIGSRGGSHAMRAEPDATASDEEPPKSAVPGSQGAPRRLQNVTAVGAWGSWKAVSEAVPSVVPDNQVNKDDVVWAQRTATAIGVA